MDDLYSPDSDLGDIDLSKDLDSTDYNTPDIDYNPYNDSENLERYSDLLKSLTNFNPFIRNTISELLGLYWNEEKEKFVPNKNSDPIVNYEGARRISLFLKIYARDNNMLMNLGETVANNIEKDIIHFTHFIIGANMEDFGIKTNHDLVLVMRIIEHSASFILESSWGSKTPMDFMGNSASFNSNVNVQPPRQEKKESKIKGFFNKFVG